ncbi:MAG TPA: Rv3654c family TadE-like protein [Nocardioidaceae bacterium]|nr:Rv3654c family TadE-like protein [Nocardioidaceae bacterium]
MRSAEDGSATVLGVVLVCLLTTVALVSAVVAGVLVGQRRAAAAADLAALAAAEALGRGAATTSSGVDACGQASRVSHANAATMTGCLVEGSEVVVEVAVEVRSFFGAALTVPGRARAGRVDQPVTAPGGLGP